MLVPKTDFVGLDEYIHLAAGGETPWLKQHDEAIERFRRDKSGGMVGRSQFELVHTRVRERLAAMLSLESDDIALLGNASTGIGQVISSFEWRAGDNVVVADLEFPSGSFALARLQKLGVELRVVKTEHAYLALDDMIAACDERTRLVVASYVSYFSGQRIDVKRLAEAVHQRGAALLLDATHGLGVVPVPGQDCDFVVSSCYKWLLGTAMGILAWNRKLWPSFEPMGVGWRSTKNALLLAGSERYQLRPNAIRAEAGNPNHLDVYILDSALAYLSQVGIETISAYVLELSGTLRAGMRELGLDLITPEAPEERAGNICFLHPESEAIALRAAEKQLLIWGSDGRVRSSVHLYVTRDDIDHYLTLLPELL
jgi:cysteine desulfurase/selenocysteine lyase